MTLGGVAALIAAVAFLILVGFVCWNLRQVVDVIKEVQETVRRANTTIDVLTKDIDNLSIEVEGLLNKSNALVDDVNSKIEKTDPLFAAIGDLGVTVSDLNDSTKTMATNIISGVGKKKPSRLSRLIKAGHKATQSGQQFFKSDEESVTADETPQEEPTIEVEINEPDQWQASTSDTLYEPENVSTTAGKIYLSSDKE